MMEKKKTALVLGGGGARGAYEVGVWQALREMGIRPDIVTGTSIGALNGAVIVQDIFETASEFWQTLETRLLFDVKDVIAKGGIHYDELKIQLLEYIDEEAIRKSSLDFGIVTVEMNTITPKQLWKEDIPDGMLVDYILASASFFPAISPYEIGESRYIDGAYADNLPVDLALSRGAEYIIAVDLDSIGFTSRESLEMVEDSILIKSQWDLGHFLQFEKDHTKHLMRLGYLDALKAFSAYDGGAYCFIKGQMDRRTIKSAEAAARIFHLDPELIYSKEIFQQTLRQAVENHRQKEKDEIQHATKTMKSAIWSALSKALSPLTAESLTLAAAQYLDSEKELRSPILSRAAKALFGKEISAAQYLVKENIIPPAEDHII